MKEKYSIWNIRVLLVVTVMLMVSGWSVRGQQSNNGSVGFIYLEHPNVEVTLAEPHTFPELSEFQLSVRASRPPRVADVDFVCVIKPDDGRKFAWVEYYGKILKHTNGTDVTVSTRDTGIPTLNELTYTFTLDVIGNDSPSQDTFYVNSSLKSFSMRILPSNYPFGLFEFNFGPNLTLNRFGESTGEHSTSLMVQRKFGTFSRVLVRVDTYEHPNEADLNQTRTVDTSYLEFDEGDDAKRVNLSRLYSWLQQIDSKYPRFFTVNLTSTRLMVNVSEFKSDDVLLGEATDILPDISRNQSRLFVQVIDDRSFVEFADQSRVLYVHGNSNGTVELTLTQSRIFNSDYAYRVNFFTVPAYSAAGYSPARPFTDYAPSGGYFTFEPKSKVARFNFRIGHVNTDDRRMFIVSLADVHGCNHCVFGLHRHARIYVRWTVEPFNNLIGWTFSHAQRNNSDVQVFDLKSNSNSSRLCVASVTRDVSLRVLLEVGNVTGRMSVRLSDTPVLLAPGQTTCVDVTYVQNLPKTHAYCFNVSCPIQLTTGYVINRKLGLYSAAVSRDLLLFRLVNTYCCRLYVHENVTGNVTGSNRFRVYLNRQENTNVDTYNIPLVLSDACATLSVHDLTYSVEFDSMLKSAVKFPHRRLSIVDRLVEGKYTTTVVLKTTLYADQGPSSNTLRMEFHNLDDFKFYSLSVVVRLHHSESGQFRVDRGHHHLTLDFIPRSVAASYVCCLVRLNPNETRFALTNGQRVLNLAFRTERQSNKECLVDLVYAITVLSNTSTLDKYISNDAENFFFTMLSNANVRDYVKVINVNNRVYMQDEQQFLVNVTSILSLTSNALVYLSSAADSYLTLNASKSVSNGRATLSVYVDTPATLVVLFDRVGSYSTATATYSLALVDSAYFQQANASIASYNRTDLRAFNLYAAQTTLHGRLDLPVQLRKLRSNITNTHLILYGSVCYFHDDDDVDMVFCSAEETIAVEPDGLFQFAVNSSRLTVYFNQSTSTHQTHLTVERELGALNPVSLHYKLVFADCLADLYLNPNDTRLITDESMVSFDRFEFTKSLPLVLNRVHVTQRRLFSVYLTNVNNHETGVKISPDRYVSRVSLLPHNNTDYVNVLAFGSNLRVVNIFADTGVLILNVSVYRLGSRTDNRTTPSVWIQSAGYGQMIPRYIQCVDHVELVQLAQANFEFKSITRRLEFEADQTVVNVSLQIFGKFHNELTRNAHEPTVFYLYLHGADNGGGLVEPSTQYSPYMRVELRKLQLNMSDVKPAITMVGYVRTELNQTILVRDYDFKFVYRLNVTDGLNVSFPVEGFGLRWRATVPGYPIGKLLSCAFPIDENSCENLARCRSTNGEGECTFALTFRNNSQQSETYQMSVRLTALPVDTPLFSVQVDPHANTAHLTLKAYNRSQCTVALDRESLLVLKSRLDLIVELKVKRTGVLNFTTRVTYRTSRVSNSMLVAEGFNVFPAEPDYDYESIEDGELVFEPNEVAKTIRVTLRLNPLLMDDTPNRIFTAVEQSYEFENKHNYPRQFRVQLGECEPSCTLRRGFSVSNVTIVNRHVDLWKSFTHSLSSETAGKEDSLRTIKQLVSNTLSQSEILLLEQTFRNEIGRLGRRVNHRQADFLLNILCDLMPRGELTGRVEYLQLLEDLLFVRLDGVKSQYVETNASIVTNRYQCPNSTFNYACSRVNNWHVRELKIRGDFFDAQLTVELKFRRDTISYEFYEFCLVELTDTNWLGGQSGDHLLNRRSISLTARPVFTNGSSVASTSLNPLEVVQPTIVRLKLSRPVETNKQCSILDPRTLVWSSDLCQTRHLPDSIECACYHQSIYGIHLTGNTSPSLLNGCLYAAVISLLIAAIIFTAVMLAYLNRAVKLFLAQIILAHSLAQLAYLIVVAVSERVLPGKSGVCNVPCLILGLLFHYFVLLQFSSMLVRSIGTKYRKLLIGAWLIPAVILGSFGLVGALVYEYQLNYGACFVYSDVLDSNQLCFVKNLIAYVLGCVLPGLALFLISVMILVIRPSVDRLVNCQLSLVNPQTGATPFELFLYAFLLLVNLVVGVNVRHGYEWLLTVHCLLDFALAAFLLVCTGILLASDQLTHRLFGNDEPVDDGRSIITDSRLSISLDPSGGSFNSPTLNNSFVIRRKPPTFDQDVSTISPSSLK